jgi:K+-transporting ATPase ATPase B chain
VLAKQYGIREHELEAKQARFVPFTAQTRMSGVDLNGTRPAQGRRRRVIRWVSDEGGQAPPELQAELDRVASLGSTRWPSRATRRCSA